MCVCVCVSREKKLAFFTFWRLVLHKITEPSSQREDGCLNANAGSLQFFIYFNDLDDLGRLDHIVEGCLQWGLSHSSVFTNQDAINENILYYCSYGFYNGIGINFICRLLFLQDFRNVLHVYFTALSGIGNKQSRLLLKFLLIDLSQRFFAKQLILMVC